MIKANPFFFQLKESYLFSTIARKVTEYQERYPEQKLIKLGIGDTVLPLPPTITAAWVNAVREMESAAGYRGYGPEQGYAFLRAAIAEHEYCANGIDIDEQEVFVSDGAKCDSANIQELFDSNIRVAISNPVYPVYYDSNIMAGRGNNIFFLNANRENGFVVEPPALNKAQAYDLIYLCYPNNPTGVSATCAQLQKWIEYAHACRALIIFDAAYERFITTDSIPHSIYEIDGAKEVAVEMRSYSKTAGFTGVRCAFTIIPKECRVFHSGEIAPLHPLWLRRCTTKFNGVSYPVQRAAAAIYTKNGSAEVSSLIAYYLENAKLVRQVLDDAKTEYYGGVDSPYIWLSIGNSRDSWEMFDFLLTKANIVTTPGVGFGSNGEGYIRISCFNIREQIEQACLRMAQHLHKSDAV